MSQLDTYCSNCNHLRSEHDIEGCHSPFCINCFEYKKQPKCKLCKLELPVNFFGFCQNCIRSAN